MPVIENKDQHAILWHLNFFHLGCEGRLVKFRQAHGLGTHPFQNFLRDLLGIAVRLAFLVEGSA